MSQSSDNEPCTSDVITRSGKLAFLGLFGGAGFWLVLAGLFSLVASVKMHSPTLLSDCEWMSYGRLKGAANGMLMFGFGTQAAVAVSLWLVAILGRTKVRLSALTLGISKLYNIAMFIGVVGIMYGDTSGFPGFEFPRYASGLLLFAFIALALPVFITLHNRTERQLYPSLWFVIGGMFWFAWIFSTGILLLQVFPVRGILSAAVHGWVVNGLTMVWLLPISIAVILYLTPNLANMAMPSRMTAVLGFWGLAFFAPWGGVAAGTPLPSWVGAVSTAVSALILVPILCVYYNVAGMKPARSSNPVDRTSGRFVDFSFLCLLILGVFTTLNSFAAVSRITEFTYVVDALRVLAIYGVAGSAMFAVAYQVISKLAPASDLYTRFAGMHFQVFRLGVVVSVVSFAFAGLRQGRTLAHPESSFMDATLSAKMMFRMSTTGDLILLIAAFLFMAYVAGMTVRSLLADWKSCSWCGPNAKVEVAS